jgi:sterol desaturase/sphingolipid hydroxylase (fatty acid hydroxylase superfamily)
MLIISPIIYGFIDKYFIDHSVPPTTFHLFNIITILLIQNIGYYLVHKLFHMSKLYKFHKFHHKFDKILIPSLGNAVSITEFTLAYMLPFVMGAYITHPSELSMIIPLFLVAILNMSIHCQELNKFKYPSFIVSPKNHFIHHQERNKHFAAPILNIDRIINSSQK